MRRVVIESPFAGHGETAEEREANAARNERYARACMLDCLRRHESPYASHLLYTQCLDDTDPDSRELGIMAGFAWRDVADVTVVYTDRGISGGMKQGIADARMKGRPIEFRSLGGEWAKP